MHEISYKDLSDLLPLTNLAIAAFLRFGHFSLRSRNSAVRKPLNFPDEGRDGEDMDAPPREL